MKRLFLVFLALALLVLVPFFLLGERFEEMMSFSETVRLLEGQGRWAWAVGIGLLVIDLFLPVLGTVVMSALGIVYGWPGGIFAAAGSMGAGLLGYGLCRVLGRAAALRIAGEKGLEEGERIFRSDAGGWLVALSRWMPVLPEVIACMAGLTRMPFPKFLLALACGSIPLGFTFAIIGTGAAERPVLTLLFSAGLPPLIWACLKPVFFSRRNRD